MAFSLASIIVPIQVASSSRIATFTDGQCKNAFQSINAENGYPNGTCTRLADQGKYESFQVVGLDPGCSATIYGADSEEFVPCSSTVLQFDQIAECYNSSFVYYSVDACTPPDQISSSSLIATSSSSPSSTPSSSAVSGPKKNNTGAIAGGVVGGVCGLALIAVAIFLLLRRKKKRDQVPEIPSDERREVGGSAITELPHEDRKQEMDSKNIAPQEIGAKPSVEIPPAELPGDDVAQDSQYIPDSQLTIGEKR
ncbi:hypothetical protein CC77DRAFT_1017102 [Alternaria alternata]|uniref:Mid2 domain-containing protein n=1 Tax=Alternaria alternata TaxID=5599 RepID=A0A177DYL0_ALTAL|nr:hypothetical protein CC77DRAFT_1017102 [Alternaria alternata]OAG24757.1 hypothetical protein CC77DRAFT_1017102 [Alternaria alternata]